MVPKLIFFFPTEGQKEKRRGENRVENGRKEPVELMNEGERSTRQR